MAFNVLRLAVVLGIVAALGTTELFAQVDPRAWLPPDSNVATVVRVSELLNSPYGRRQKWLDEYRDAYATGAVAAPPSVMEIYRATEYRPYGGSQAPVYSVFATRVDVSMSDIAKHELSKAEKIGDTFAVPSQRGLYFVRLGNKLLGGLEPADRQLLSRWLRYGASSKQSQLSQYLHDAISAGQGGQVVAAVDLTDMSQPEHVAAWLAASPAIKAGRGDVAKLTEQFTSLQGMRLSVSVKDDITGQLRIDFERPIVASAELMKAIVVEWLSEAGAHLATIAGADATIEGNSLVLQTALDEQDFRRILSLLRSSTPAEPSSGETGTNVERQPTAIASLRYYKGVVSAVLDLSAKNRRASEYEKTALWHEQHAVRIENLSTANVDPDLSAWGYDVAQKLRALASSLRGVPVNVDKLERSIRYDVRTYNRRVATTEWGAYFRPEWMTVDSNLQDVRAAQQDTIAQDMEDRQSIWTMLEEDRLAIVKKMNERYGIDFEKK